MTLQNIFKHIDDNLDSHLEDLITLCKIPSISFPEFDPLHCKENAKIIAELYKRTGLENVQVIEVENAHPFVYADYCHKPGKPTILLYAHYDVQPVGRENIWESKPFEPIFKEGIGGKRLYGRGTADDKAAIITHAALVASYLKSGREIPVNIKILVEGEEEVGSSGFVKLLKTHKELIKADTMVVPDSTFADCGIPTITFSLRGMAELEVELKSMKSPLHSGLWGGIVPDPAIALSKMCGSLVDDKGMLDIPSISKMIPPLSVEEEREYQKLSFDEKSTREKAGLFENTQLLSYSPYPQAQMWRLPHLALNGFQAASRDNCGNIINHAAWARMTIRIPSVMDAKTVLAAFKKHMQDITPWGLTLDILNEDCFDGWQVDINGKDKKYFDAAKKALQMGYDHDVLLVGCGAAIPLVGSYAEAYNAPVLLTPMHDPYGNIHSENESLLISDFVKAIYSEVYLLEELAEL